MSYKVRWAEPGDAVFLAWVMLAAGRSHVQRGIWDIIIGLPEEECLTFLKHLAVTNKPHMCHCSTFIVAEVDGHSVAALSGHDPVALGEETMAEQMPVVMEKMGLTAEDIATDERGLAAFMTCKADAYEGAWIVENVATWPEFRRMGLIDTLLRKMLDVGRTKGFELAQVSFYIGNMRAQRAYERAGFKYHDEKRHPDFEAEIGCPGIARFLREL